MFAPLELYNVLHDPVASSTQPVQCVLYLRVEGPGQRVSHLPQALLQVSHLHTRSLDAIFNRQHKYNFKSKT